MFPLGGWVERCDTLLVLLFIGAAVAMCFVGFVGVNPSSGLLRTVLLWQNRVDDVAVSLAVATSLREPQVSPSPSLCLFIDVLYAHCTDLSHATLQQARLVCSS